MTRIFSYSTFTAIFSTLNCDNFKTRTGKFNLDAFVKVSLHEYNPGTKYSSNLTSYVKFWSACWLKENLVITAEQYENYLSGKNKI